MNFSCLMAVYYKDSPDDLKEALESLRKQSLTASQVVLVEDGPLTTELDDVIKLYTRLLAIKSVKLKENKGLGYALNIGLQNCDYDIVCRADADDKNHPKRFEKQIQFLKENPDIDIVGTWAKDIDEEGRVIKDRLLPTSHEKIVKLIWTNPITHPTVAFRKNRILSVGSYNTSIKRKQDYDLWFRAAANGLRFANIPEFLVYYRFTDNFYKKNNTKNEWLKVKIGFQGLRSMKVYNIVPYIGTSVSLIRSLLPDFVAKPFHKLLNKFDPRSKK